MDLAVPLTGAAPRERRGLLLAFVVFGAFWGAWAAVLPAIRQRAGVGDGQLGLALAAVAQYRRAVQGWWAGGWDVLITPTLAEVPLPLGTIGNDAANPMSALIRSGQFVPFTPPFNTTGQPAISLPLHWTEAGLPVGVQLVAAYGREDLLIRVAAQLEAATPWIHRTPPI